LKILLTVAGKIFGDNKSKPSGNMNFIYHAHEAWKDVVIFICTFVI
jgi:hypothetical protein